MGWVFPAKGKQERDCTSAKKPGARNLWPKKSAKAPARNVPPGSAKAQNKRVPSSAFKMRTYNE